MNELFTQPPHAIAGIIGISLSIIWIGSYIISWICIGIWDWVDDKEKATYVNPIFKTLDFGECLSIGMLILVIPLILYGLWLIWEVVVFVASTVAFFHLVRYARRHKKLFDKHVKDKDMHTSKAT